MNTLHQFFIGIDVSKPWFDAALLQVINHQKSPVATERFANTAGGLKAFGKWLDRHGVTRNEHTLVVIGNTGIYHRLLWLFCSKQGLPLHIGNAAHIKWSFGIARGKSDYIDSLRLCQYAFKEQDTLRATPVLDPEVLRLKDFQTSRIRLIHQLNANKTYLRELSSMSDKHIQGTLEKAYRTAIKGIAQSIAALEAEIQAIIAASATLSKNYGLLLSIPGIGPVTAVYLLCCTSNFAGPVSGKQLACYAGLAPFEHSSGKSVRGRTKVHKMGNKELKSLLHMGARSAVRHCAEYKAYYERKLAEGKHDLFVLNAVKNKIVLQVAAVIKNGRKYVDKPGIAA